MHIRKHVLVSADEVNLVFTTILYLDLISFQRLSLVLWYSFLRHWCTSGFLMTSAIWLLTILSLVRNCWYVIHYFFMKLVCLYKVCEFQLYIYTLSSVDIRHSTLKMFVWEKRKGLCYLTGYVFLKKRDQYSQHAFVISSDLNGNIFLSVNYRRCSSKQSQEILLTSFRSLFVKV